jgi:hypothetical protein
MRLPCPQRPLLHNHISQLLLTLNTFAHTKNTFTYFEARTEVVSAESVAGNSVIEEEWAKLGK